MQRFNLLARGTND